MVSRVTPSFRARYDAEHGSPPAPSQNRSMSVRTAACFSVGGLGAVGSAGSWGMTASGIIGSARGVSVDDPQRRIPAPPEAALRELVVTRGRRDRAGAG